MRNPLMPLAVLAAVLVGTIASAQGGEPATAVERGRRIYVAQGCYQCHGYVGQGAQPTGPALVPVGFDDGYLEKYLRSPRGIMPAYSARILPGESVALLSAYLHSIAPGRAAGEIPQLARFLGGGPAAPRPVAAAAKRPAVPANLPRPNPAGQALYRAHCAACHGADRQGVVGPRLDREAKVRSFDATLRILLSPPPGMPKLSPRPLSVEQMKAIAEFIRTSD